MSAGANLDHSGKIAYSIPQFCSACAVGRTFVYEEIKAGRLRACKAGRRTIIDAAEARRWLAALQRIAAPTGPSDDDTPGTPSHLPQCREHVRTVP